MDSTAGFYDCMERPSKADRYRRIPMRDFLANLLKLKDHSAQRMKQKSHFG